MSKLTFVQPQAGGIMKLSAVECYINIRRSNFTKHFLRYQNSKPFFDTLLLYIYLFLEFSCSYDSKELKCISKDYRWEMEQPNSIVEDLTCFNIDLITVYDAILEGRQTQQKLVFVCESVVKKQKEWWNVWTSTKNCIYNYTLPSRQNGVLNREGLL